MTTIDYRHVSECVNAIMRRQNNLTATVRPDLNGEVADLAIVRGVGAAAGRPGEVWEIKSPDQMSIIRLIEVLPEPGTGVGLNRDIVLQLFRMHKGKRIDMGSMTFRGALAAPLHVAEAANSVAKAWIS